MNEILKAIKLAAPKIADALKYADKGYATSENQTGDRQLKLDILSDEIIFNELKKCQSIKAIISEEREGADEINPNGKYIVAYDPLDGSSLVDVNFSVGSIFGIYEGEAIASNLKAAVYTIYGARLELVSALENEAVKLYQLGKDGEFGFVKEIALSQKGKLNATGATQKGWSETHAKLVRALFNEGYRLRYSGAMVADLHQILLKGGGLFSYPATTDAPNGKLRLLFEVLPFALIYERAGGEGVAANGTRLLDIKVNSFHQTSPCYFGSKYEINEVKNSL
ncbi:class 1 fructose-bisphosphatase [Campylobacter sp. 19-13652]|uniref:class 1 fructose-bisphosphatase n=1 Tax=Campylobacter sp. 19-13652 TaxID=2840180 RepID=UPI001C7414AF|nr:class 1 fructose-bisphosphatase [Campylobacter sp. 19-13652]BCX79033.1 fructose-1,6-bisphosphatase class 1 [Campylobacter sp. 19-13652]